MIPKLSSIRLIPYQIGDESKNMAIDEFLLQLDQPCLRFYGWKRPTLSLGRSNSKPDDIDFKYCKNNNIPLVKRLSGGGAVLHQYEITYCFSSDISDFSPSIIKTYQAISTPILNCFYKLGLKPEMTNHKRKLSDSSVCFNEISNFELSINKKKVVGSAQYRQKKRFIQHGSILIDVDFDLWQKIWRIESKVNFLKNRVTTLNEQLKNKTDHLEIINILVEEFSSSFKTSIFEKKLQSTEIAEIQNLMTKYQL